MKFTFCFTHVFSFSLERQCVGDINVSQYCQGLHEITLNFRSDKPAEELLKPSNLGFIHILPCESQPDLSTITTLYGSMRCRTKLVSQGFSFRLKFTKVQCGNDIAEDLENILQPSENILY